jgi:transposase-like protein
VQAIASKLGHGRTTIYRWVRIARRSHRRGSCAHGQTAARARACRRKRGGGLALLDTLDRLNRSLAASPAQRQFIENERDAALRVITSSAGKVQPWTVGAVTELITQEVRAGTYRPAIEPATLGYADRAPRRGVPLQRRCRGHAWRRRSAQGCTGRDVRGETCQRRRRRLALPLAPLGLSSRPSC